MTTDAQKMFKKCSFFYIHNSLKMNDAFKKVKNGSKFSLEMFCQFKNLLYLCTRFREATRQRGERTGATIDP